MAIFFLIMFGIYFFILLLLLVGWERSMTTPLIHAERQRTISLIVPVRNEEENISNLIQSAQEVNYPPDKFELILVDDHSTDRTAEIARKLIDPLKIGSLVSSDNEGKKFALTAGVARAKGEIIATTDADCQLPTGLLEKINACFENAQTQLVLGAVRLEPTHPFFLKLQSLEFASLIGSAAGATGLGFPILCNGANLAFRKSAFYRVNGYEGNFQIPSGDDEFLMRKIQRSFGSASVRFLNSADAVVSSTPQPTVKDFLQQRIRWASKWKHNTSVATQFLAIFIFVLQASWIAMGISMFSSPANRVLVYLSLAKICLEGLLLWRVTSFLQQRFSLAAFFTLQFLYPLYVGLTGLLANVTGARWKGRRIP